ncbi:hypothetical protein BC629DRAFT_1534377 [Irpex lacteus]|nr:hypothetical protein BC629DRAFT_1534377 [Irpex lacteus]
MNTYLTPSCKLQHTRMLYSGMTRTPWHPGRQRSTSTAQQTTLISSERMTMGSVPPVLVISWQGFVLDFFTASVTNDFWRNGSFFELLSIDSRAHVPLRQAVNCIHNAFSVLLLAYHPAPAPFLTSSGSGCCGSTFLPNSGYSTGIRYLLTSSGHW